MLEQFVPTGVVPGVFICREARMLGISVSGVRAAFAEETAGWKGYEVVMWAWRKYFASPQSEEVGYLKILR